MAKVLVVDDRPANRDLLVTLLGYRNHTTLEAGDGGEALALLDQETFDLIISDILMPSMDGYEFVRRLRAHPRAANTSVVFCTAYYLSREASALASACGVAHILYKPLDPTNALALIESVLGQGPVAAPAGGDGTEKRFDHQHLRLINDQLVEKTTALERANGRLALMLQFLTEAGCERRLQPLITAATQTARTLVGARYAMMAVCYEDGRIREQAMAGDVDLAPLPSLLHPPAGPLAEMWADPRPRLLSGHAPAALGLPPARSFLVAPITSAQAVCGWMVFGDKLGMASFDQEDEDVARMIGSKMGIVFENTLLAEQLTEHAARLEAAHDRAVAAQAEAERANLAKSKFLAAASHDLRQPVQSLTLLASLLRAKVQGTPLAAIVGPMDKALEALRTLLSSILDISKLDAGGETPTLQGFRLQDLLDRVANECRLQAEAKGLDLHMVPAPSLYVRTDPGWLERIVRNLVENAIRYTNRGKVLLGCRRRGDSVFLEVLDTGIGIPPDQIGDIFEEFYQVGNPGRNAAKGLGLGLAIVQRLARLMGHKVRVQSEPNRGSRFSVELPATTPPLAPEVKVNVIHSDFRRHQVLIIEDEDTVCLSLTMTLEGWGFRVVTADSGEAAVAKVTHGVCRPDLILADARLGAGIDGVEAIRLIRLSLERAVPAVLLTGDTAPQRLTKLRASGTPILHKPIAAEALRDMLQRLLQAEPRDVQAAG